MKRAFAQVAGAKTRPSASGGIGNSVGGVGNNGGGNKRTRSNGGGNKRARLDPSLEYINKPGNTPIIKLARQYFAELRVEFQVVIGELYGWRGVAKLAVRGTVKKNRIEAGKCIGLFKPGSHDILPCLDSPVHHKAINKVSQIVENACVYKNITGYREDVDTGLLKYIIMGVETATEKVQLTLVVNIMPTDPQEELNELISYLVSSNSTVFHSIWVHYNAASKHNNSNTGRGGGDTWVLKYGTELLEEMLKTGIELVKPKLQVQLCYPPNVFRQANLAGFTKIIQTIRKFVTKKCRLIELYGGVGTIGLNLIDLVSELQCSDENPYNKKCFEHTINGFYKKKYRKKAVYISEGATDRVLDIHKYDVCLVDPPRKGLDSEVLDALLYNNIQDSCLQRIVYISCGFKAFVQNCNKLLNRDSLDNGPRSSHRGIGNGPRAHTWRLVHAEGHVLFPVLFIYHAV